MSLAAQVGLSPGEWREMTPRELHLWAEAYLDRNRRAERDKKTEIYNLAGLIRVMVWAKHPPRFQEVFPDKTEMDDDEMYETVRALNRLMGGEEEEA